MRMIILLSTMLFLSACSQRVMTKSIFDMNNEYKIEGQWMPKHIGQAKLLNIHGLSPIREAGEIYFLYPSRGIESAYPILNSKLKGVSLYKKVIKYRDNNNTKMNDLHRIKTSILNLDKLTLDIVEKEVQLIDLYDNNETNVTTQINRVEKDLNSTIGKYNNVYEGFLNDFNNTQGLLIAQWAQKNKTAQSADAGDIINVSNESSIGKNGFIIASGITIESLYLDDNNSQHLDNNFTDSWFNGIGIVTYLVSAENFIFVNRASNKKLLKLAAEVSAKDIKGTINKIDKIKLELAFARSEKVFSTGQLSESDIYICEKKLNGSIPSEWKRMDMNNTIDCSNNNKTPFFSVFTEIDKLPILYVK